MNAAQQLKDLGYEIRSLPPGNRLEVVYTGSGHPDPDQVTSLVRELRSRPAELRAFLAAERDETLRDIFRAAVREIEAHLFHEMLAHIQRQHPETWAAIRQAEEQMEDAWRQAEAGSISLEQFRAKVDRWRDLHLGMAQEHAAKTCADCPDEKAHACRDAWRSRDRQAGGQQPTVWTEPPPGCGRRQ